MSTHPKWASQTYNGLFARASGFPVGDPVRLLAVAVLCRWVIDARDGCADPAPQEWAILADVPRAWLEQEERVSGWTTEESMIALA